MMLYNNSIVLRDGSRYSYCSFGQKMLTCGYVTAVVCKRAACTCGYTVIDSSVCMGHTYMSGLIQPGLPLHRVKLYM